MCTVTRRRRHLPVRRRWRRQRNIKSAIILRNQDGLIAAKFPLQQPNALYLNRRFGIIGQRKSQSHCRKIAILQHAYRSMKGRIADRSGNHRLYHRGIHDPTICHCMGNIVHPRTPYHPPNRKRFGKTEGGFSHCQQKIFFGSLHGIRSHLILWKNQTQPCFFSSVCVNSFSSEAGLTKFSPVNGFSTK